MISIIVNDGITQHFCLDNDDLITMRIQLPKRVQLIFHRGAKVRDQPKDKLIKDTSGLLLWKENDRAVASFKKMADIENSEPDLAKIVRDWISAALQKQEPNLAQRFRLYHCS